jgi:hypothetical protein
VDADAEIKPYSGPARGWGSVKAVGAILTQEQVALLGSEILLKQNKTDGVMCVSCSWAKPASPHPFEFCENGAKATAWEITTKTTTPEFFSKHTLTELRTWTWKTMGGSPMHRWPQERKDPRVALTRSGRAELRFTHEVVDLGEQIRRPIRLTDKAAVIRNLGATRLSVPGSNHEKHTGPPCMDLSREIHTVQCPGHLNVSEK